MAPNTSEAEPEVMEEPMPITPKPDLISPRKFHIAIRPVITFTYIHIGAIYGIYLAFTKAKWMTLGLAYLLYVAAQIGITAGAHRLWAHRCYKAKTPLQIILMLLNTVSFQNTASYWVRDHRQHHKYCDTDGDPHNARRGFFYSHIGWLMTKKSEEVRKLARTIDMSDIESNPVLMFQKRYAFPLIATVCFALPTFVPYYFWGETLTTAWYINLLRYAINLNTIFLVNSAAHLWGFKPYDKNIMPTENLSVSLMALGEGFHNYHHTFPWDYKAGELGNNRFNATTWFIDFFAWIGWAYDLKQAHGSLVTSRAKRTGDGSGLASDYVKSE